MCVKQPPLVRVTTRCLKGIDMGSFIGEIRRSSLLITPAVDLSDLVQQYDSVLSSVLDSHTPCIERVVTKHPLAPWYTPDIKAEMAKRRKLERKWWHSRLTINRVCVCNNVKLLKN